MFLLNGEYTLPVRGIASAAPETMSARLPFERVRLLDNILASSRHSLTSAMRVDVAPAELHLRSIPFERIQQLTAVLKDGAAHADDDVDRLCARLLVTDYLAAVAHLRAVARIAAARIEKTPAALKRIRRYVEKEQARLQKRRASTAPSE